MSYTRHIITWLAAASLALALSTSYLLDGPSEIEAARDTAASVADAQRLAVRDLCGSENASVEILSGGSVQCRTKRGRKTHSARPIVITQAAL